MPLDLLLIMREARKVGEEYVNLDQDAPTDGGLPIVLPEALAGAA